MANSITDKADDVAEGVNAAGRKAGASARQAGESVADNVERASSKTAGAVQQAGRRGSTAYQEAADEIESHRSSLEETIRQNPLASAGAALVIGLFLGRFVF